MSIVQDSPTYRFGDFTLDVSSRELLREEERLDLNARYFDALVSLVREQGRLIEKDRFFEEVWSYVVVTDGALTQCIKDIRRQLSDDASNPRFIQDGPPARISIHRRSFSRRSQSLGRYLGGTGGSGFQGEAGDVSVSAERYEPTSAILSAGRGEAAMSRSAPS